MVERLVEADLLSNAIDRIVFFHFLAERTGIFLLADGHRRDFLVDLDPAEMARGYDAQLMKGIEVLLDKIKEDPRPWPKHEPIESDR